MPKLPILTAFRLAKILCKQGFEIKRTSGSHQTYFHPVTKRIITIPMHRGHDLGRGITRAIIKDAGYTDDEFMKLLK